MSEPVKKLEKPQAAWRSAISPERYQVLFEEATEPPRSAP